MQVLTMKEAAKVLRVNVNKVNDLRRSGKLKCIKIGSWKTTDEAIKEFITANWTMQL